MDSYLLFSSKADIRFSLIKDNFLIYFSLKNKFWSCKNWPIEEIQWEQIRTNYLNLVLQETISLCERSTEISTNVMYMDVMLKPIFYWINFDLLCWPGPVKLCWNIWWSSDLSQQYPQSMWCLLSDSLEY